MISVDDAVRIHSVLIEKFGGSKGIRDKGMPETALMRPYQTFTKRSYIHPLQKKLQR